MVVINILRKIASVNLRLMEQAKVTKISKEDYSQIGEEEKAPPLRLNHPNQEFLRLYC